MGGLRLARYVLLGRAIAMPMGFPLIESDRRHADDGQVAEGVELLAIGFDILDPGLDGLKAWKLVNDHTIGIGRLADVDPELLAVAQGDALAAVARHQPHDLGYDLAVVVLYVVNGGVNDHVDGHAHCLLLARPDRPLCGYTP